MIKVEKLCKNFGNVRAVDGATFSIQKGEIVGILGPNGAGKTTMMRILTGFLSSDKGLVEIDGINIETDPVAVQKKIGYLPENNPLYKNMQAAEFLELAAQLHQIPNIERKAALDFAVKAVGIEKVFYRPISELSKGYKQRVGIAAALIHRPEIIILDEPTEGLDPNQRTEIRQLIKELAKEHTILMSTHVMQEASAVCNRLLIINKGKVIADGTADELSRQSHQEKIILFEVEGVGVVEKLRALAQIKKVEVKSQKDRRLNLEIVPVEEQEIQPLLARLIWENKWVVWKLDEQEYKLEETFQILTKE